MIRRLVGTTVVLGAAAGAAAAAYALVARPRHLRWGATPEEVERAMPGDDYILFPRVNATHAVTIAARAADVWPWVAQMGRSRAGVFSYDWLGSTVGPESSGPGSTAPEQPVLNVGDEVAMMAGVASRVAEVDAPTRLVLTGTVDPRAGKVVDRTDPDVTTYLDSSWAFALDERDAAEGFETRLVARFRADYTPQPGFHVAAKVFMEPALFAMDRKLLLGIKRHAEAGELPGPVPAPAAAEAITEEIAEAVSEAPAEVPPAS
jgi:hypothetical protein